MICNKKGQFFINGKHAVSHFNSCLNHSNCIPSTLNVRPFLSKKIVIRLTCALQYCTTICMYNKCV